MRRPRRPAIPSLRQNLLGETMRTLKVAQQLRMVKPDPFQNTRTMEFIG